MSSSERESLGQAPSSPVSVSSAEALKYVIFLADVNQLYLVALGLYDPDLVLMVAQHSQKDPKEYLPLLARLRSLPPPLARYEVDVLLQRWPRALQHLAQAGTLGF
jgi:elongator complex protein 1